MNEGFENITVIGIQCIIISLRELVCLLGYHMMVSEILYQSLFASVCWTVQTLPLILQGNTLVK